MFWDDLQRNRTNRNTVDPGRTWIWIVGSIYMGIIYLLIDLFTNPQSAFCITGFCIHGGPAVCIDLGHFIKGTWVSVDFGIYMGPGSNPLWILRDNWSSALGESKFYVDFQLWGIGSPNPYIVQRSAVYTERFIIRNLLTQLQRLRSPMTCSQPFVDPRGQWCSCSLSSKA